MCRPNTLGGRRCPSHSNPAAIANRNARRRAQYAKNRGKARVVGSHLPEVTSSQPVVAQFKSFDTSDHPLYGANITSFGPGPMFIETGKVETNEALGITTKTYSGEMVNGYYLDEKQISGRIDYTALTKDSYKDFGFQDSDGDSLSRTSISNKWEIEDLSAVELKALSPIEQTALRLFTTSQYEWINGALYGGKYGLDNETKPHKPYFVGEKALPDAYHYEAENSATPSFLKELTGHMDAGLDRGPKQQRVLYRGMSNGNRVFNPKDYNDTDASKRWVDENIKLGQEMIFDGYQSASVDAAIGLDYAKNNGVLYEIRTASGVNVTNVSEFDFEKEVILPRGARYMVVGVHQDKTINSNGRKIGNVSIVQLVEITEAGDIVDSEHTQARPALTQQQLLTKGEKLKTEQQAA